MILVVNTKGGSSKSTVAMQILAPWVYTRNHKAVLVEFDDQNHDSADYTDSVIETHQLKVGKESLSYIAIETLIEQFETDNLILDIGGNRTSEMTLDAFGLSGYETFIELIVIPVSSTGQDVTNARKTLELIKEKMPRYKGEILLAISRVIDDDISVVKAIMPDAFDFLLKERLIGPIIIPARNCFAMSRKMKRTVWELGEKSEDLENHLQDAMLESKNDKDITRAKEIGFLNKVVRESKRETALLNNIFSQLDNIFEIKTKKSTSNEGKSASKVKEVSGEAK